MYIIDNINSLVRDFKIDTHKKWYEFKNTVRNIWESFIQPFKILRSVFSPSNKTEYPVKEILEEKIDRTQLYKKEKKNISPSYFVKRYAERKKENIIGQKLREDNFVADLHVHPMHTFKGYVYNLSNVESILDAMDYRDVDLIASVGFPEREMWKNIESEIYDYEKLKTGKYKPENLREGFKFYKGNKQLYIIKGEEVSSIQGISAIIIGNKKEIKSKNLNDIIKEGKDKGGIVILNTPYINDNSFLSSKKIDKDAERYLINTCENPNTRPDAIDFDAYALDYVMMIINGIDINEEARKLARNNDIRIVAGTDLHARNQEHLKYLATSFIAIPKENIKENGMIIDTLKYNIQKGDYFNHRQYVSELCLAKTFLIPGAVSKAKEILKIKR